MVENGKSILGLSRRIWTISGGTDQFKNRLTLLSMNDTLTQVKTFLIASAVYLSYYLTCFTYMYYYVVAGKSDEFWSMALFGWIGAPLYWLAQVTA
jgi:hypothetical protein